MDMAQFFLTLVIVLLSAKLMGEGFARFALPAVLGEVVAGLIMGPSLLGWVEVTPVLHALAEIGILLLLFEVGLETDVAQLLSVGTKSVMVAVTGIIAPAILAVGVCVYALDMGTMPSIFIGGTLVATSIGISLRVLRELDCHRTQSAKVVLGAAVLDDIAGVLILAILFDFAITREVDFWHTARVLAHIVSFLLVAPVLAKLLVPGLIRAEAASRTSGIVPTLAIALILIFAFMAHGVGAPSILGAFAAGIALSRHFYLPVSRLNRRHETFAETVEEKLQSLTGLFVPVFFFVVGASINLSVIDFSGGAFWLAAVLLTAAAVAGKLLSGLWAGGSLRNKLFTGMAMVPRGEVGLIFAEVGRKSGVMDESLYAITVFVVALTTFIAPVALRHIGCDNPERTGSPIQPPAVKGSRT